jgi:hypothetical protein
MSGQRFVPGAIATLVLVERPAENHRLEQDRLVSESVPVIDPEEDG